MKVRSDPHYARPLLQYFGVAATSRASLALYNTHAEMERFMAALAKAQKLLRLAFSSARGRREPRASPRHFCF
ncbi:hypothetical protein D7U74_03010 [Stenotrophomonas maltophilia]|uniref:aminotransferase class V-fold PLP-dependent enzyme n=1 Tax=Stenotrophomonas maltophilia TaxID=40324 RepID=UPI0015DFCF3E|nr:hypothetical protein [Stenotrophomonas maltophilia]